MTMNKGRFETEWSRADANQQIDLISNALEMPLADGVKTIMAGLGSFHIAVKSKAKDVLKKLQENIKDALCRGITSINYMPITDKLVIKTDNYITAAKLASCKDVKDIFQHCFGTLNHLGLPAVLHKVIGIGNKTCQLTIGDYVDVAGENSVSFRTFVYGSDDLASFLAKFKAINPVMAIGGVASRHSGSKTNGGLDLRMAESLKDYNKDDDIICLQTVVITDYNWINGVLELFV